MDYNIIPRENVLLVSKHKNTQLNQDIVIEETDNDKSLITATVIKSNLENYIGKTIIIGKYSLFGLNLRGEQFFFCNEEDVIAVCDYTE